MSKISLRANRLANEFEGYADARRTKQQGLDPEDIHTLVVSDKQSPVGIVEHALTTTQLEDAAKLLRQRGDGITVTDEQLRAINAALDSMPYGGMVSMRRINDVDGLIGHLCALSAVLAGVASRAERDTDRLRELQSQQRAMRTFLGIADA